MTATISRRLVSVGRRCRRARWVDADRSPLHRRGGQLDAVRLGHKTLRIKVDSIERFIDAGPVGNWR